MTFTSISFKLLSTVLNQTYWKSRAFVTTWLSTNIGLQVADTIVLLSFGKCVYDSELFLPIPIRTYPVKSTGPVDARSVRLLALVQLHVKVV